MMLFEVKQCRAIADTTGKRCVRNRRWEMDVCWQHGDRWYAGKKKRTILLVDASRPDDERGKKP